MWPSRRRRARLRRAVDDFIRLPDTAALDTVYGEARSATTRDAPVVFSELFRVATHAARVFGSPAAEPPLTVAVEVALTGFTETGDEVPVRLLAEQLHRHGMNGLSLSLLEHAVELAADQPTTSGRVPPLAALGNALGERLRRDGELHAAEAVFTNALQALDAAAVHVHPVRSMVCNNLGLTTWSRGDLATARVFLLESLKIDQLVASDELDTAITLDNLGRLEVDLAVAAGIIRHDGYVNAIAEEHLNSAEEYLGHALRVFRAGLPATAPHHVTAVLNSAELAWQRDDSAALDELGDEAVQFLDYPDITDDQRWLAVALHGEVLFARGRAGDAVAFMSPWFDRLLAVVPAHEVPTRGLPTLLRAAVGTGDQSLADHVAALIIAVDDARLAHQPAARSRAEMRRAFAEYHRRTSLILGHCLPAAVTTDAPQWLYELVLNRKGLLCEQQGADGLRARSEEQAPAELVTAVRALRAEVARIDLDGAVGDTVRAVRRRQADAERELGRAEASLRGALGNGRGFARRTIDDIQQRLGPGVVLLDFVVAQRPDGNSHYLVFHVTRDGPVQVTDLGAADKLDTRLREFNTLCTTPHDTDTDVRDATALNDIVPRLFGPAEESPEHVIVAPTGIWAFTPFCLLPDATGRPLIERTMVELVPSARWLLRHHDDPAEQPGPPVVIGDPDFDLDYASHTPFELRHGVERLDHARAEVNEVAHRLGVTPVVDRDATRQRLLDAERPRVLHVATHGDFIDRIASLAELREPRSYVVRAIGDVVVTEEDDSLGWPAGDARPDDAKSRHLRRARWLQSIGPAEQLSRSALLLAGFNSWIAGIDGAPDVGTGMISASEFALLDLRSTELVVLSACETGVGAVDYADGGVLGLRTAALAAGAACCISTLWKVDDAVSALLIGRLYDELATGATPGAALSIAQSAVRAEHPDPYYWAGWVADGAPCAHGLK